MKIHWMKFLIALAVGLIVGGFVLTFNVDAQTTLGPIEQLGEHLYFDPNLSEPDGQSCADCHHPDFGFDDPDNILPVSEGVIPGLFGGRNSPISAYAMYSPMFYFDEAEGLWIGGQFWDGRATGAYLGDPLADQAVGPFLNPVEMANPDMRTVIRDVAMSSYAMLFQTVWGTDLSAWATMTDAEILEAYNQVGLSIAAFERTQLFGQFSSRYDLYLSACLNAGGTRDDCAKGQGKIAPKVASKYLTSLEWKGLLLFVGENNNDGIKQKGEGAMCSACHLAEWTRVEDYALPVQVPAWAPAGWVPPLFTDFTYDNLGIPKNTAYPLAPNAPVDYGLGGVLGDPLENGKFKVMTLRNIDLSGPYGHNGYFTKLNQIVDFYNTRDVPGMWPAPEVAETVNIDELGNLALTNSDVDALVAFMKALSDGSKP